MKLAPNGSILVIIKGSGSTDKGIYAPDGSIRITIVG